MNENKADNYFFETKNINLQSGRSKSWVEESFDFSGEAGSGSHYLSLSLPKKKILFFLLFIVLGWGALLGKGFYLQVVKGDYYFSLAEDNRTKVDYTKARRGIIYDRNHKPLVQNVSGFSLFIVQAELPKDEGARKWVIEQTANITGLKYEEIMKLLEDNKKFFYQPVAIQTGIDYERAMALKIMSSDLMGVRLESDFWRKYLYNESMSHILGYVGKISEDEYEKNSVNYLLNDNIGKSGLEKFYESGLKGVHGQRRIEVDAFGREKKIIAQNDSIDGSSLVLSIDAPLQEKVYQLLKDKFNNKKNAVVIISNPQNGEILSLVDYPSYDNNLFAKGISQVDYQKLLDDSNKPLFSRAVLGEYPSGSTIKPVMAIAALEEKIANINTTVNSVGGIHIGQWTFPDWKAGGHGTTNVIKAIAQSVNTYFYYIGGGYGDFKGLGVELIDKYLTLFGIGEKTGIDLPSEKTGFVPTEEWKKKVTGQPWYIGDTYHLSIGQGDLLVTPLQINSITATIANGGTYYKPRLGNQIITPDGQVKEIQPEIIKKDFVSAQSVQIVRSGMRETILSGSARSLGVLPIAIAGKTGTAQWNSNKSNHAWFTTFAPYDKPTFCITILVEEGVEGSTVAVPIAKDIYQYWFVDRQGGQLIDANIPSIDKKK